MKVLDSKVLLQIIKENTKTESGFILPENTNDYERAKVISIGDELEKKREQSSGEPVLKPGDEVYIYLSSGKKIKVEGEEYRVVTSNEIIVIL